MTNPDRQEMEAAAGGAWFFGSFCLLLASIIVGTVVAAWIGAVLGGLLALGAASFIFAALFGPRRPE